MADLILASQSPRRRELLALTGLSFDTDVPDVDETCDLPAGEAVAALSLKKATAVAAAHPGRIVLAADTLVSVDGRALGKPRDEADAFRMLRMLSGRWHEVYTGVTVIDAAGRVHAGVDESGVHFTEMTDEDIRAYIATGEPTDKAGAYAVQGIAGLWIDAVRGSSSNIIGLPLCLTRTLLRECGLTVPAGLHP